MNRRCVKTIRKLLLALVLVSLVSIKAYAYNFDIPVVLNGVNLSSGTKGEENVKGFISGDRTYLPLRFVSESLGYEVTYDHSTRAIGITSKGRSVQMNVRSRSFTVNGEARTMDVMPILYKDRTYIPVRYVAESFNLPVDWDGASRTVYLGRGVKPQPSKGQVKPDAGYQLFTFGNPKATIKVPKSLMKDIIVKKEDGGYGIYNKKTVQEGDPRFGGAFVFFSQYRVEPGDYEDFDEMYMFVHKRGRIRTVGEMPRDLQYNYQNKAKRKQFEDVERRVKKEITCTVAE